MGFNVNTVSRTEITLCGEFPKETALKLFEKATGSRLASMEYEYDSEADKTTLKFYPCVIQEVESEITEMTARRDDLAVEKARLTSVATAKNSTVAANMENASVTGYATE